MPEARSKKTFKALAGALIAAALVVAPLVTAGATAAPKDKGGSSADGGSTSDWTKDTNHVEYWEALYTDHEAVCFKVEGPESSSHGTVSEDGKSITLKQFDVDGWDGDHWEVLVIKAGSAAQTVVEHPQAGVAYASPINNGGQQATISHWIVCKGTTPEEEEPEQREPIVKTTELTTFDCGTGVATTTSTTTTTAYVRDSDGNWKLGEPQVSQPIVTTRLLTDAEKQDCPETTTTTTEWKDGTWVCGDTTVEQTRTVTTTVGDAEPTVVTEKQSRELTQAEIGTCPLVPGDIEAVCVGDVPYLGYGLTLPEGFVADSETPVTITFLNPDGENYVVTDQPLSGELLWPGASDGEPKMWPGWELVDGEYAQTDGNFAWTRQGVTVRFDVNPTYSTEVDYPQASAECANPPIGAGENPTPTATPAAVAASGDLAVTGGGVSPVLVAAGGATLAAGIAVVAIAAYRRRRTAAE